ncbi:MAG: hypothetical protein ACI9FG_001963, partial [Crocinitomicaceae bacterium]
DISDVELADAIAHCGAKDLAGIPLDFFEGNLGAAIYGDAEDETFVVVRMVSEHFEPAWCLS